MGLSCCLVGSDGLKIEFLKIIDAEVEGERLDL
jgi:hypothetical protein